MDETSFATVEDLEARWRTLTAPEKTRAEALLEDASALVRDLAKGIDQRLAAGSVSTATVRAIVCAVVKRAMQGPTDHDGVTQVQQSAGPFSQGVSFANPTGDLYLTKVERSRLGGTGRKAFALNLTPQPRPLR